MIAGLRIVIGMAAIALATIPIVLFQPIMLRIGRGEAIIPRFWHRTAVWALGIKIHKIGSMSERRPLLLASNHMSWTDIVVLGSFLDVNFIAKSELAGWPVMGWLCRFQRTVFVDRNDRRGSGDQAGEIAERMGAGHAMVLFPEGTTDDGNLLLSFKSSLFGAAKIVIDRKKADLVHVQPVAIAYTRLQGMPMTRKQREHVAWIGDQDLWPHLKAVMGEGALDVEVHFGEPVAYRAGDDRKALARRVEADVRRMMAEALYPRHGN
jgi:1-acyl-sn-glycerol-3-phosphate acyltransferase